MLLKVGDSGPEVLKLKKRMSELGYTKVKDGKETLTISLEDPEYSDTLGKIVENMKAKLLDAISIDWVKSYFKDCPDEWLQINPDCNPAFWNLLENYEKYSEFYKATIKPDDFIPDADENGNDTLIQKVIKKVIELFLGEVGVRETGTSNTGTRVNEYQFVGSCGEVKNGGSPWCSYFVKWLIKKALLFFNIKNFMQCGGYTPYDRQWGIENYIAVKVSSIDDIDKGDQFLIYGSSRGDAIHTGIVVGKKNGKVITGEGNTNSAGSADGGGVEQRLRNVSGIWYVIKWWKLIPQ